MHILAATDFSTRSQRAVRRAGLLARDRRAELTLVHVVDDDRPAELVTLERREAERVLGEQISAMPELRGLACSGLVLEGDPFEGILRAAGSRGTDLLVMGAPRRRLRDLMLGTTVERVIRAGPYPVLMVSTEADRPYRTALAAVDMSDPSANALRTALALGVADPAGLTLIHAFLPLGKGKMTNAGLSRETLDAHVAEERDDARQALDAFLDAHGISDHKPLVRLEEGTPFAVISAEVERLAPDVLVIGTHGRSGIAKAFLGSVAEQVLRSLEVDVLATPPLR